jgi:hypothetical protein
MAIQSAGSIELEKRELILKNRSGYLVNHISNNQLMR